MWKWDVNLSLWCLWWITSVWSAAASKSTADIQCREGPHVYPWWWISPPQECSEKCAGWWTRTTTDLITTDGSRLCSSSSSLQISVQFSLCNGCSPGANVIATPCMDASSYSSWTTCGTWLEHTCPHMLTWAMTRTLAEDRSREQLVSMDEMRTAVWGHQRCFPSFRCPQESSAWS